MMGPNPAMSDTTPKPSPVPARLPLREAAFFALLFIYVWRVIDPQLIYDAYWTTTQFPVFRTGRVFLAEFLRYPGGLTEYASAFLCQLFHWPWLGALVITITGAVLSWGAYTMLSRFGSARPVMLHLVPAPLLAVLYNRYCNVLPTALAVATALAAACLYTWLRVAKPLARFAVFAALSWAVYYTTGGGYLLFVLLCAAHEAVLQRRWVLGAACLLSGGALPYVAGRHLMGSRFADAFWRLMPFHERTDLRGQVMAACLLGLLALLPVLARLGPFCAWLVSTDRTGRALVRGARRAAANRVLVAALPVAALALVLSLSLDAVTRTAFRIEHYSRRRMWPEALQAIRSLPVEGYSYALNWEVNRALCRTGRLPHDMFRYPQHPLGLVPSPMMFPNLKMPHPVWMKLSDVLMDLGRINEAEHMAYEALEMLGDHPHIMERIIRISAAKGNSEQTSILLRALSRDVVRGPWAREFLARLRADPSLAWDTETVRCRELMVREDTVGWVTPEVMLEELLQWDEGNRRALEYLTAHYLLSRDLDGVVGTVGRLRRLGYTELPDPVQEALIIRSRMSRSAPRQADPAVGEEAIRRHEAFRRAFGPYGRDLGAASAALRAEFGDTFLYYFTFGASGGA